MISNCGHDENGKYSNGKAGDQTGSEWSIIPWYSRPWNVVLRHPDGTVRELIAQLATECANNDHIGYDQNSDNDNDGGRYSLWSQLKANDYDPRKITKDCETDCSNGVACIIKSAGYILNNDKLKGVSVYSYTGNLKSVLVKAGFYALTDSKYLKSDEYLYAGDILLYEGHHTATNITNGAKCVTWYPSAIETYRPGLRMLDTVNIREYPGTGAPTVGKAEKGTYVLPTERTEIGGNPWLHIADGWISGKYCEGWIKESKGLWWYLKKGWTWVSASVVEIGDKWYAFDKDGYLVTADRLDGDGAIKD